MVDVDVIVTLIKRSYLKYAQQYNQFRRYVII